MEGRSLATIAPKLGSSAAGFSRPASIMELASLCSATLCVIERITAYCSESFANRGISSQIWKPGVAVLMGRYGPRISCGASGFMSHESSWLSPPYWWMKMQDLGEAPVFSARSSPGRANPNDPIPPACSRRRRENGLFNPRFITLARESLTE